MAAKKPKVELIIQDVEGTETHELSLDGYRIPLHPNTHAYLAGHKISDRSCNAYVG